MSIDHQRIGRIGVELINRFGNEGISDEEQAVIGLALFVSNVMALPHAKRVLMIAAHMDTLSEMIAKTPEADNDNTRTH